MTQETLDAAIAAAVAAYPIGIPGAVKCGQWADRPYIAVLKDFHGCSGRTHIPNARSAFATAEEATASAAHYVRDFRESLARRLAEPRMRALRAQHGLPRDI